MIRHYRDSDLDALLALFHDSVHRLGSRDYTDGQLAAWAPPRPDRAAWSSRLASGRTRVAEWDGRVAGFARAEANGGIDLLYVHPDCVRRGVGGERLRDSLGWLLEKGVNRAWAQASDTARPAFERHGFRVVERRTVVRGGVEIRNWTMERALDT